MTLQSDSKFVCRFLCLVECSWQGCCGSRLCPACLSEARGPCWSHDSDITEFCSVKLFFLFVIKHVREKYVQCYINEHFFLRLLPPDFKDPLVALFYIYCYIVSLSARHSHCHPFQKFYFLSKQMKFGERSFLNEFSFEITVQSCVCFCVC